MAQHQDLKRKGGADPDHQTAREHDAQPPPLSIEVPKMRDLPNKSKPWSDVQLPVDILLLTVEDCEFLACYTYLTNAFKSYHMNLGDVYFGTMGESGEESLKVALMRCSKGSSDPSGSLVTVKNAVVQLGPKAVFSVGCCAGFNQKGTNLGDVVVSSTLTTDEFTAPVRRNIANLIRFSTEGWKPPLKDPAAGEQVQVHRDRGMLSGINEPAIAKQRRKSESQMIASEWEGEGLFAGAHDLNLEWVIVKGISHFSNDSNTPDESWKSFSSIMAASLVSKMLNNPVVFKEWPHYEVVEESSRKRKNLERHKVQRRDKVPREIKAQGPEAKLAYGNALKTGKVKVYRARIMLIGQDRAGKTSLKKSFVGLPFDPEEDSTDGIEVDPSIVDIDQVKNWQLTDKKLSVSQFALDLAKMVAKEIQERDKDKEVSQEDDEEDSDDDYEKGSEKQREKKSKLGDYKSKQVDPDEDTNKQTKMGQSGLNSPGEPRLSKPPAVNSQMNQDIARNASKETKAEAPVAELNVDATSPPEEFTDYLDQLLKGLNLQTDATAVEHHMILDLWDFAGQQLYYASYPVFLSPRAVYMLVYDLNKGLNDPAQPCFKQGGLETSLGNPNEETNMENLLSWLVSVSSICSSESEKAVKNQPHCRPPVFIVGTHADKQHQKDINEIELQINRELVENSENVIRAIFSVDNTQGSSDKGVSALQKRMIEVLKREPYMGEEIPIRWFNFEKVVKALVAKKVYHLNMEQLQTTIQKHCFIENKDEVATMLNFYHDLGVIVKHGNTVILQAEWLIKLFKQLITVRCFKKMKRRHCKLWKEMEKTGVLNMELVEHVFSEFCQQGVVKEDILEMMMKFGLIVQFAVSPTEEKYFVPCQLRSPSDNLYIEEPSPEDPCPLYLDFQRRGYVPHGLYLQLVSRCITWCSTSGFKEPPVLYDGSSLFFIGRELMTHQMILVCKKRFIKIVLRQIKQDNGSSCEAVSAKEVPILVRTFLIETMQNLQDALPWFKNVAYELCVKCPYCLEKKKPCDNHGQFPCHDERCLCLLTVKQDDGSCTYCRKSHPVKILPLPGLKRWFSSSSEDSSIKDTSEEDVETSTVSKKKLPTSIGQLPDYQDRIF